MLTKQIELVSEQVDSIIIEDLKEALEMNLDNSKLSNAIQTVLEYYMTPSDFEVYKRELALTKMVRENERLGLYE